MEHTTIAQSPEPSVEAAFWKDMGWNFCNVRGLKRFASRRHIAYRQEVRRLLERARSYDELPSGFVSINDAEIAWGESLMEWALYQWEVMGRHNGPLVRVVILRGQPMIILRESALRRQYGAPKWTSVTKVCEAVRLPYMTIYGRLRYSACRRKAVRRWVGGYHMVFNAEDVESEMQLWRTTGRCSNVCPGMAKLKGYDGNDEIARSQWRQTLLTRGK